MNVEDVVRAVERLAPARLAAGWDSVGLVLGGMGERVRGPVVVGLDLTDGVLAQARRVRATMLVVYHPPLFGAVKRVTDREGLDGVVLRALRQGVSVYSPHTALDAAAGGMAEWLAGMAMERVPREGEGLGGEGGSGALEGAKGEGMVKVVTFVPAADVGPIRDALSAAGAGRIGAYTECSFGVAGVGTFRGGAGSSPAVGRAGRLEQVEEVRLEMVCPRGRVVEALRAVRAVHPYEEAAVDVVPVEVVEGVGGGGGGEREGLGRWVDLERAVGLDALARRVRGRLKVKRAQVVGEGGRLVRRVGVCPGAGGSMIGAALARGCDALVTGEMDHHRQLEAARRGLGVVLLGHGETERPYLPVFAGRLSGELGGARVVVAEEPAVARGV